MYTSKELAFVTGIAVFVKKMVYSEFWRVGKWRAMCMLDLGHGEEGHFAWRDVGRRYRAAGGQVDIAPLRDPGGLGGGTSEIMNYASAADCQSTLECLRGLGIGIE